MRQQLLKQTPRKENDFSSLTNEIWNDTPQYDDNKDNEGWDVDIINEICSVTAPVVENSWGGLPASEDWDLELNKQELVHYVEIDTRSDTINSIPFLGEHLTIRSDNKPLTALEQLSTIHNSSSLPISSISAFTPVSTANVSSSPHFNVNTESSWGASLTGSTWESTAKNILSFEINDNIELKENTQLQELNPCTKLFTLESPQPCNPRATSWAGLDSFEPGPCKIEETNNCYTENQQSNVSDCLSGSIHSYGEVEKASQLSEQISLSSSLETKIDSNLKVTGWLQNSTPSEDWDLLDKQENEEDLGWTTVSLKTKVYKFFLMYAAAPLYVFSLIFNTPSSLGIEY